MNYPAAELRSIKMNFYLLNPDAEHRGILLNKYNKSAKDTESLANFRRFGAACPTTFVNVSWDSISLAPFQLNFKFICR